MSERPADRDVERPSGADEASDAADAAFPDGGPAPEAGESSFSPFRYPIFRAIWTANLASNFGGMIYTIGAAWLMTSLSQSPAMVALVQASVTLPIMLFSLITGAIADNFDRRRMMIAAQGFMLLMSLLLTAFAAANALTPWLLLLFTFLIGCGQAAKTPAWQASVGDLVPRSELSSAVALNSMGFNIARSVGPAIGGAVVAAAGAATAFASNAIGQIALIIVLFRWKQPRADNALPRESLGGAIAAGLRFVAMSPSILVVLLRGALFGFAACAVTALLPLVARDILDSGPLTYGVLLGSFGVGAIIGAVGGAKLRRRTNTEAVTRLAAFAWAVGAIVVGVSRFLPLTMAALVVLGAGFMLALSTFNVTVQFLSPRWVVARTLSLYQMTTFGSMAIGSWLWGAVASHADTTVALIAAGGIQFLSLLAALKFALPDAEHLNLDPMRGWSAPETAAPVQPNSGPVVITIDYLIDEADTAAFLAAMKERRRTRLRNGAIAWSLMRDLSDAEKWSERYRMGTWLDYLRHNTRTTQLDAEVTQRVRALHRGPDKPVVRRMIEYRTGAARAWVWGPDPQIPS